MYVCMYRCYFWKCDIIIQSYLKIADKSKPRDSSVTNRYPPFFGSVTLSSSYIFWKCDTKISDKSCIRSVLAMC